jgi:hypothetical protein
VFHLNRQFFTAIAVFMTAYSFQFNLFPVVASMKLRSNNAATKAVYYALAMAMVIYVVLSVLSIYTFGSSLQPDVLDNVNEEIDHQWESITLRIAFIIVIVCHIPYVFFSAKEAMLIIVDEWDRQSISQTLTQRLITHADSNEKEDEDELMAYHSMNTKYYYGVTVAVYLFELLLAMIVKDLGIVF